MNLFPSLKEDDEFGKVILDNYPTVNDVVDNELTLQTEISPMCQCISQTELDKFGSPALYDPDHPIFNVQIKKHDSRFDQIKLTPETLLRYSFN